MKNNNFVINGVTYHPQIDDDWTFTLGWEKGLIIYTVRLTQFPNIFYLRITKVGLKWPPVRSIALFENKDAWIASLKEKECREKKNTQ
jgi:hypothetical protein